MQLVFLLDQSVHFDMAWRDCNKRRADSLSLIEDVKLNHYVSQYTSKSSTHYYTKGKLI